MTRKSDAFVAKIANTRQKEIVEAIFALASPTCLGKKVLLD